MHVIFYPTPKSPTLLEVLIVTYTILGGSFSIIAE